MKRLILSLLFSVTLAGATSLLPLGPWLICESPNRASFGMICAGFEPGHEMYLLSITPTNPGARAYEYEITGFLANGTPISVSGVVRRADDSGSNTNIPVSFGGVVYDTRIIVHDLVSSAVSVRLSGAAR